MSDISSVQLQQFKEAEQSRTKSEIKQIQTEGNKNIRKELEGQDKILAQLKKDFEKKSEDMKSDLEYKLIEARKRHDEVYVSEKTRLDQELENIRKAHEDRVAELKVTHENQLQQMNESQANTINNSQQKFAKEKVRMNG